MPTALKSMIVGLAYGIEPTDDLGRQHSRNALSWLAGTDDIFRRVKPLTRQHCDRYDGGNAPHGCALDDLALGVREQRLGERMGSSMRLVVSTLTC